MFEHAVILCAGKGERLLGTGGTRTKAMVNVGGRPLVSYSLEQLTARVPEVGLTVGTNAEELMRYGMANNIRLFINTAGKENAWWIYYSLFRKIDGPVLVMPCDNITHLDLDLLYSQYIAAGAPACMLVPVPVNKDIEGDYIHTDGATGLITAISRQLYSGMYGSGIQVLNPAAINTLAAGECDFLSLWQKLISRHQLYAADNYPYHWFSVNTAAQLQQVESDIQNHHCLYENIPDHPATGF